MSNALVSWLCAASFLGSALFGEARAQDPPMMLAPVIELPDLAGFTFILGAFSVTALKPRMTKLLDCAWSKEDYFPTTCGSYLVELTLDQDNMPLLRMTYENPPSDGSWDAKNKDDRRRVISVASLLGEDEVRISSWLNTALDASQQGNAQSSTGILDGASPVWALVCSYHPRGDAVPPNGYTDVFFTSNPTYIVGGCGQ